MNTDKMSTKEKILQEALALFSVKGFDAVSVRDIVRAVGIKESSLYNHFASKQDIFDTLIRVCSKRNEEFFHSLQLTGEDMRFAADERTVAMYQGMTNEQFAAIAGRIFDFYFADETNVRLRRMLTIEQYRNEAIGKLFRDISFDDAINYQAALFAKLMEAGYFRRTDPYLMALAFFSPIFLLFYKFDNNAASLSEARELFLRHIAHFGEIYAPGPSSETSNA